MLNKLFRGKSAEVDFSLNIQPQQSGIPWDFFRSQYPAYSIALDGYVDNPTEEDFDKPIANYDHHRNRLFTRSTSGQVWMAIREGLMEVFSGTDGIPKVIAHVSGCDEDDCGAVLMLSEPHLVYQDTRRRLEKLIDLMDKLDTTAGTYPMDLNHPDAQSVFWVTDPYREFRVSGEINRRNPQQYHDVIDQVGLRMKRYIAGTHRRLRADTRYEVLHREKDWIMINEIGKQGRMGAISDGNKAVISYRPLENGQHQYVFVRLSNYVSKVPLPEIANYLNALEFGQGNGVIYADKNELLPSWGGAENVIGSPKGIGSKFSPQEMVNILRQLIPTYENRIMSARNGNGAAGHQFPTGLKMLTQKAV